MSVLDSSSFVVGRSDKADKGDATFYYNLDGGTFGKTTNERLDVFTDVGPVAILIEGEANYNQGSLSVLN